MSDVQVVLGNRATITVAGEPLDPKAEERRKERVKLGWQLRRLNNAMFPRRQIGKCGLPLEEVTVGHRKADGRAAIGGVSSCGSVHGCLRCGGKIRSVRAAEIGYLCRAHLAEGLGIEFVTLTLPHWGTDSLDLLIAGLRTAWRKMTQRKPYARMRSRFEVFGMIRSTEFKWSLENGWHPHLHILFFLDRENLDEDEEHEFKARLYQAWQAVVSEVLPGRTVHQRYGVDVRPVRDEKGIGEYVSKIEFEMTRSDLKTDRTRASENGSRTPWQIAADFLDTGEATDQALWREYIEGTHELRILGMSQKLRDHYGRYEGADKTDDEIAAESTEIEPVVNISAEVFMAARNKRVATVVPDMITAFEHGGTDALLAVLSELGPLVVEDRSSVGEVPLVRFRSQKANVLADTAGRTARLVRKSRHGFAVRRHRPGSNSRVHALACDGRGPL